MRDILEFIFQSFWHWLGFAILLGLVVKGIVLIFITRIK